MKNRQQERSKEKRKFVCLLHTAFVIVDNYCWQLLLQVRCSSTSPTRQRPHASSVLRSAGNSGTTVGSWHLLFSFSDARSFTRTGDEQNTANGQWEWIVQCKNIKFCNRYYESVSRAHHVIVQTQHGIFVQHCSFVPRQKQQPPAQ